MPYNSKPGARKYGDKPESMSSFKMRSGNGALPFKEMGGSPVPAGTYESASKADPNLSSHIDARNTAEKGSQEYNIAQNKINTAYGSDKKHDVKIEPITRKGPKDLSTKTKTSEGPIKPSKTFEETSAEIKAEKTVGESKPEKKKFDYKAFGDDLMRLGQSKTFQGEGAKDLYQLEQDAKNQKADQKSKDKNLALADRKMNFAEEKYKTDLTSQNIKDKRTTQLIALTDKANNNEMELDATDNIADITTNTTYADEVTKKYTA